jgi:predicted O-methyltransferase YrrM
MQKSNGAVSSVMFYNPENSRGWVAEAVYSNAPAFKLLKKMYNDPEAPGQSDIGIRKLLYTTVLNLRPRRVLEIGCHIGSAAIVMGAALRRNGWF